MDNSHQPNSRWYSGSGIYRNVHMIITDNVHIAPWGVRCCTNALYPELDQSTLHIQTTLENDSELQHCAGVTYQIFDHKNQLVSSAGTSLSLKPNSAGECAVRPSIEHPHLWSVEDRHLFPQRRICGSENPAVGGDRGIYKEDFFWGSYATATMHHEALWRYTVSRDFVAGDFLWTGIDYLGECRWPRKGAACGPLDTAGFEKDAYYYFRSIWNKDAITLHLLPHWNWTGQDGEFKQVVCYTNCEE